MERPGSVGLVGIFEAAGVPRRPGEAKDEFLDVEVSCVKRPFGDVAAELRPERTSERLAQREPKGQRRPCAVAALDLAESRTLDAHEPRRRGLGEVAPASTLPHGLTQSDGRGHGEPGAGKARIRTFDRWHTAHSGKPPLSRG